MEKIYTIVMVMAAALAMVAGCSGDGDVVALCERQGDDFLLTNCEGELYFDEELSRWVIRSVTELNDLKQNDRNGLFFLVDGVDTNYQGNSFVRFSGKACFSHIYADPVVCFYIAYYYDLQLIKIDKIQK